MTKIETTLGTFNVTEDYQTVKSEIYRGNAFVELNKTFSGLAKLGILKTKRSNYY